MLPEGERRALDEDRRALLVINDSSQARDLASILGRELHVVSRFEEAWQELVRAGFDIVFIAGKDLGVPPPGWLAKVADLPKTVSVIWLSLEGHPVGSLGTQFHQAADDLGSSLSDEERFEQMLGAERNRTLANVMRGIAHHLNTTLSPIQTSAQTLLQDQPGMEAAPMLADIVDRSQQAEQLIERLQVLSETSTGEDFELVDISMLLGDLVDATEPWWGEELRREGREVRVRLSLGRTQPLLGDIAALREAFLQLLTNAVEAIPVSGQVDIRTESSANQARVMFTDNIS